MIWTWTLLQIRDPSRRLSHRAAEDISCRPIQWTLTSRVIVRMDATATRLVKLSIGNASSFTLGPACLDGSISYITIQNT